MAKELKPKPGAGKSTLNPFDRFGMTQHNYERATGKTLDLRSVGVGFDGKSKSEMPVSVPNSLNSYAGGEGTKHEFDSVVMPQHNLEQSMGAMGPEKSASAPNPSDLYADVVIVSESFAKRVNLDDIRVHSNVEVLPDEPFDKQFRLDPYVEKPRSWLGTQPNARKLPSVGEELLAQEQNQQQNDSVGDLGDE